MQESEKMALALGCLVTRHSTLYATYVNLGLLYVFMHF